MHYFLFVRQHGWFNKEISIKSVGQMYSFKLPNPTSHCVEYIYLCTVNGGVQNKSNKFICLQSAAGMIKI